MMVLTPLRRDTPSDSKRSSMRPRRLPSRNALKPTSSRIALAGATTAQWEATLATYADPIIGSLSVQGIDTTLVLKVLEAIWTEKPETAVRLRGRIEKILGWAKVRGYREGENPARWRDNLDNLLPARGKVRKIEHHAALPYGELPRFLVALREQEGIAPARSNSRS
jgi:hypothetical protein